jgi:hypothetical protein
MRRLILVNGPPRSGKDEIGKIIERRFAVVLVTKFAKVLKERTHALYNLYACGQPRPHDYFESQKDTPMECFLGLTPRQAYINVSELLMKPTHGKAVFGKLLAHQIEQYEDPLGLNVVTDSGFVEEAQPLLRTHPKALLIRMHREGCDFKGDSRSYIDLPIPTVDVDNNGSLADLEEVILLHLRHQGFAP